MELIGEVQDHGEYSLYEDDESNSLVDLWASNEDLAEHLLANGVTLAEESKWISVSERLPEKDMGVLLYDTQSATTFLGEFCSKTTLFAAHWFADNETWDISEFTHWMPLPTPPKENDNA